MFLKVVFFDVFEVLVCTYFQFVCSGFVTNDDAVLVHLQGADGPHLSDTAFYGMLQGAGLVVTVADNQYFLG